MDAVGRAEAARFGALLRPAAPYRSQRGAVAGGGGSDMIPFVAAGRTPNDALLVVRGFAPTRGGCVAVRWAGAPEVVRQSSSGDSSPARRPLTKNADSALHFQKRGVFASAI